MEDQSEKQMMNKSFQRATPIYCNAIKIYSLFALFFNGIFLILNICGIVTINYVDPIEYKTLSIAIFYIIVCSFTGLNIIILFDIFNLNIIFLF